MNILSKIKSSNVKGSLFLFILIAVAFFYIFTYTFSEANTSHCHESKSSIAGLLPLSVTNPDVFLGEYGREILNYLVSNSKTEPFEMRLSTKTISIRNLFLNEKLISEINIPLCFSSYIICPDTANHLRT